MQNLVTLGFMARYREISKVFLLQACDPRGGAKFDPRALTCDPRDGAKFDPRALIWALLVEVH